jgi:PAS domain S-box-containing protein/putative nucleotidyltransferase with HDIG domain
MLDTTTNLRVLIVEDSADDAALVLRELRKSGYHLVCERVETAAAMRAVLHDKPWDIILSDYVIPGFGGMEALLIAKQSGLDLPFILVSGKVGEETAVEAMRAGATDFVMKDRLGRLGSVVQRELTEAAARKQADKALHESENKFRQMSAGAQDAIIVLDQDGAVTDWNAAAEKIFGYATADIIGRDLHSLLAPARMPSKFENGWQQFRTNGTGAMINKTLEVTALRRDGTEFPVELSTSSAMLGGRWHAIGIARDITDRKRMQREVIEQFKLAETFFNSNVSCLVILDRNFNFVRVNEAYAMACRKEVADFAGRNHFDMYPSDTQAIFDEVVRTKRAFTTFSRAFVFADQPERGTTYWDWTLMPILDQQDEVEYLVFSLHEVTERKRSEEELRAAALYTRSLIEASLDPLVTINALGKITDVNKSTEDVTGLARDRLVGTDFADYFTEPRKASAGYQQVLARGSVRDYPLTIRHSSGRTTDVLYNATVYRNQAGEKLGVFAAARDVTERKQAETMRSQLAAIVRSSNDAIIGMDPDGIIRSWNPGAEKVYGYCQEEVVGKPVSILAPVNKTQETRGLIEAVQRGESIVDVETDRVRKDGTCIEVAFSLSPIKDSDGSTVGVSAIARDITEKKQGERMLHKVNRTLKTLSNCNQTLIHATDEMQLLNDVCRVIVDDGGYRLAWVGYAEHDAQQTVRPVAQSGQDEGYLATANFSWADTELGRGPSGMAIRTGIAQINQNFLTNPALLPWRESALARGYESSVALPLKSFEEILGVLTVYATESDAFNAAEVKQLQELADDLAFGIRTLRTRNAHERSAQRLLRSMEATIQAVAGTVEMRDAYTAGHQRRVAELASAIARDMGLVEEQVHGVYLAAVVHDVGKIQIPAEILTKPGKLSRIEFELIKSHPEVGYDILKGVDFPWPIAQIVYQHHERLDGLGYPRGLKSDEILLEAKIIMVADVVEAMASHRPYRAAVGVEAALQELVAHAQRYDANVVRSCISLFREKGFAFKQ